MMRDWPNTDYLGSYRLLVEDLSRLCSFIHPCDENLSVYSHRVYELLLRACTEFESLAKDLLRADGFKKRGNWTVRDYHRLNASLQLSDREVGLLFWQPEPKYIAPFAEWAGGSSLKWYRDYNLVKHNRSAQFRRASFHNALSATAGLYAVMAARFSYLFSEWDGAAVRHYPGPAPKVEFATSGSPFSWRKPFGTPQRPP
jgi:hypothetical protein